MASFNLNKLRDFIPKDLSDVTSNMSSWASKALGAEEAGNSHEDGASGDALVEHDAQMTLEEPIPIDASKPRTYLDLVNECDNFPYVQTNPKLFFAHMNTYYGLYVKDYPDSELGYVLPSVAEVFSGLPDWKLDHTERTLTLMVGDNDQERSKAVAFAAEAMRATEHFKILRGWRNELYPVYGPDGKILFSIERSASALFGVVTYGCHMTAYTYVDNKEDQGREMKLWVPRRAANKSTYPSMLDNTVAGGLSTGELPLECMIRESAEEASLPEELVSKEAKVAGTVTYFHIRDARAGGETRLLQPECQYVYDLELPEGVIPKPGDDEVASFELMSIPEVKQALVDGQFKPNCALVILDFFIRHGILEPPMEGYIEIVARLHRRLDFPTA